MRDSSYGWVGRTGGGDYYTRGVLEGVFMPASSHVTTPKDIRQAASALEGVAVRTNLERSERLSAEAWRRYSAQT